jgi:hypothetical protein
LATKSLTSLGSLGGRIHDRSVMVGNCSRNRSAAGGSTCDSVALRMRMISSFTPPGVTPAKRDLKTAE